MIKIALEKRAPDNPDTYTPMMFCDYCGKVIDEVGNGLYLWRNNPQAGYAPHNEQLLMFHKGDCNRAFEAANPLPKGESWSWDEIQQLPAQLAWSLFPDGTPSTEVVELMRRELKRGM